MLDLLAGGLSGGRCSNPGDPLAGIGNAVVFVLFDPVAFGGVEHFLQQSDGLKGYVRTCPPAPGGPGIVLASVALGFNIITDAFFVTLVAASIITSLFTGAWLRWMLKRGYPVADDA